MIQTADSGRPAAIYSAQLSVLRLSIRSRPSHPGPHRLPEVSIRRFRGTFSADEGSVTACDLTLAWGLIRTTESGRIGGWKRGCSRVQ
jgi:hypothetical protein